MVDTNHVDRVKVVFLDKDGYTVASSDLRAAEDKTQSRSIYAVHAALGLSISDILLQGCRPIIVEGPSDQYYFSAIKNFLISEKIITPREELVFVPSGGVRGIEGVASLLSGKPENMPYVIVDSDKSEKNFKNKLLQRLYKDCPDRVIEIMDINSLDNSEVEDLIPYEMLSLALTRLFRDIESEEFIDNYVPSTPILPQIEYFASKHGINLATGWKVDLSRQAKQRLLQQGNRLVNKQTVSEWKLIFDKILS